MQLPVAKIWGQAALNSGVSRNKLRLGQIQFLKLLQYLILDLWGSFTPS